MTYSERSAQIALEANIAVMVLTNTQGHDIEFLALKPQMLAESELAAVAERWPGRGLASAAVIGLCGAEVRWAFKEPLEPCVESAISFAFLIHVNDLLRARERERVAYRPAPGVVELERMYALPDTRPYRRLTRAQRRA
jgi:hypothetical protein